jgi:diaminopimelate decarboxylase
MYGSYHPIANLSHPQAASETVDVVGNLCESGDVFARERVLPRPELGDVLAIGVAGAYGIAMSSMYNLRPLPAEVAIQAGQDRLVRPRQSMDQLLSTLGW